MACCEVIHLGCLDCRSLWDFGVAVAGVLQGHGCVKLYMYAIGYEIFFSDNSFTHRLMF